MRVKGSRNELGKGRTRVWHGLESNVGSGDEPCPFYISGPFVLRSPQYLHGTSGLGSHGRYFVAAKTLTDRSDGRWPCRSIPVPPSPASPQWFYASSTLQS